MDYVALAATIGGSMVAIVGVGVTAWGISQQRASARELATSQQAHERELARGARLFDRRAIAYESMIAFLQVAWERVIATEPMLRMAGEPEPPEPPTADEWRAMYVKLATFGSHAVTERYEGVAEAFRKFFIDADHLRRMRDTPSTDELQLWRGLEAARAEVKTRFDQIERLVSSELAAL
jgi:hypothetical protein